VFLFLSSLLTDRQFFDFGWRIPFLASAALVVLGLYVRVTITETPIFQKIGERERAKVPMWDVLRHHFGTVVLGVLVSLSAFVLGNLMLVFALSWGTDALHYTRDKFLVIQLAAILFFAGTTPLSARLAEGGRRRMLIVVNALTVAFGFVIAPMFTAGTTAAAAMMMLGMALMGLVYGPLGTVLCELFPTAVRYSGASLTFNLAGIFGASLTPYLATWLARRYGLQWVGYYLSTASVLSVVGLLLTRETKHSQL